MNATNICNFILRCFWGTLSDFVTQINTSTTKLFVRKTNHHKFDRFFSLCSELNDLLAFRNWNLWNSQSLSNVRFTKLFRFCQEKIDRKKHLISWNSEKILKIITISKIYFIKNFKKIYKYLNAILPYHLDCILEIAKKIWKRMFLFEQRTYL